MTATTAPEKDEKAALPGGGAPVIVKADEEGLAPLFSYMQNVTPENHAALAQAEADRLQPWFEAFSRHLQYDLQTDPSLFADRRDRMNRLTTSGNLRRLFMEVATQTHKVMLSEIVIAPASIYKDRTLSLRIFGDRTPYHSTSRYDDRELIFGFEKLYDRDAERNKLGETAIGILALDDKTLGAVTPHDSRRLLQALQSTATLINHDMMHHIHMDDGVPKHFIDTKPAGFDYNNPRSLWLRNFPYHMDQVPEVDDIESWLIMYQSQTLGYMDDTPLADAVRTYFSELQRIGAALKEKAQAAGDPAAALKEAHDVVEYFSTVMGVTLLRFQPLNHPVLAAALDGMDAADPAPEHTMALEKITRETLRGRLRYDGAMRGIVDSYNKAGFSIADEDAAALTSRQIRLVRLINSDGMSVALISKGKPGSYLAERQDKAPRIGLEMVDAMARMVDFEPA